MIKEIISEVLVNDIDTGKNRQTKKLRGFLFEIEDKYGDSKLKEFVGDLKDLGFKVDSKFVYVDDKKIPLDKKISDILPIL